jgi:hypothetical protein
MSPATGRSRRPASEEASVAGWLLIAMGVLTIVLPSLSLGGRWSSVLAAASGRAASGVAGASSARGRWLSTLVLGAVYGLAGFCSGPVLGAILTLDSSALEFGAQDAVAAWTADVPVWVAPVAVALVAGSSPLDVPLRGSMRRAAGVTMRKIRPAPSKRRPLTVPAARVPRVRCVRPTWRPIRMSCSSTSVWRGRLECARVGTHNRTRSHDGPGTTARRKHGD